MECKFSKSRNKGTYQSKKKKKVENKGEGIVSVEDLMVMRFQKMSYFDILDQWFLR